MKLPFATMVLFSLPALAHGDPAAPAPSAPTACSALGAMDLSTIQDAPTLVTKATVVEASEGVPAYCKVEGYVWPQVGIEVRLPVSNWNGKLIAVGNGGWAGTIPGDLCDRHLLRYYACVATDTGHKGRGDDGLWARNNLPAQVDFAYRAIHVSTLAAKRIVNRFYSKDTFKSYFMSCSTGGYEGLVEAQRFPWDFDGIIAGAPDIDEGDVTMRDLWAVRASMDAEGHPILNANTVKVLHDAVLQQCDLDDGVRDGIVGNPLACRFSPAKLLCQPGGSKACLNPDQVQAAERIYQGPPHLAGRSNVVGALPGSELLWADPHSGFTAMEPGYFDALFGAMIYGASAGWGFKSFDFDRDERRLGLAALYTATNPDLRRFKAAGGKLISYQGETDTFEMPTAMVDYFETVGKVMGGQKETQEFFRLFMIPGMNHCIGGAGAYSIDYLSYLEAWVEQNKPPNEMLGAHVNDAYLRSRPLPAKVVADLPADTTPEIRAVVSAYYLTLPLDPSIPVDFTRPMYPYPLYARYKGGDPNKAASFRSVQSSP
jgi:feruloyl esterase